MSNQVKKYEPEFYKKRKTYTRTYKGDANDSSVQAVVQGHVSKCPDLVTNDTAVQGYIINLLKECIACGVDGFRFDGVTSMLYYSRGLGEAFCNYGDYFNAHQDGNAICYLTLANEMIHQVNPKAISIAEEISGMPGLAAKVEDGGYGFDYRMAMNIPDYWI